MQLDECLISVCIVYGVLWCQIHTLFWYTACTVYSTPAMAQPLTNPIFLTILISLHNTVCQYVVFFQRVERYLADKLDKCVGKEAGDILSVLISKRGSLVTGACCPSVSYEYISISIPYVCTRLQRYGDTCACHCIRL